MDLGLIVLVTRCQPAAVSLHTMLPHQCGIGPCDSPLHRSPTESRVYESRAILCVDCHDRRCCWDSVRIVAGEGLQVR